MRRQVENRVVVCTNADNIRHPWPGGRREQETISDTACREVLEETGWMLEAASIRELGWLHFEDLTPRGNDWPYPHPDFLQIVCVARAVERHGGRDGGWFDTERYEVSSTLMNVDDAWHAVDGEPLSRPFLKLVR